MLCQEWEKYDDIESYIEKLSQDMKINILASASVYVGRDTRKSGEDLIEYLISGIDVLPYVYHYNYGGK
ncbi:hypothetical protein MXB_1170 [Myxobolus squamalis]|nr:hypothetical protein MXB_1170 [Myxobolus squamalis]